MDRRSRSLVLALVAWLIAGAALVAPAQEAPPETTGPDGVPTPLGPSELTTPEDPTVPPELDAASYLLVSLEGSQMLAQKAPDEEMPVASLTKLMTAWLVAREGSLRDPVEVSSRASSQPGSTAELETGEERTVRELMSAMLVTSANDAAYALAEHISGSVEEFVIAMGEEASRLGLAHTSFASPDGFDDSGYSTARDIARLYDQIYGSSGIPGGISEALLDAAGTKEYRLPSDTAEERTFLNRNVLLWLDPRVTSGKTGFTTGAGFCIAVMAVGDDGRTLIAVVLGDVDEPFSDAAALLNYGFEGFEQRILVEEGEEVDQVGSLRVVAGRPLIRLVPVVGGEPERIVNLVDDAAEAQAGDLVGTLVFRLDAKVLGKVPLRLAEAEVPTEAGEGSGDGGGAIDSFPVVVAGGMLGGLLVLMLVAKVVRSRRRTW